MGSFDMKNKKKKIILISILLFIIIIVTILSLYKMSDNDYDKAKKETLNFLDKNLSELEKISKEGLSIKNKEVQKYKTKKYHFTENDGKEYIVININSQGMLGGQYWDLIYCEEDYLDGKNIDIYDEYKETGSGNNIFIVEKIRDNWYYSYQDWDGKVDTTKIIR